MMVHKKRQNMKNAKKIAVFWVITAVQLALLAKTLPADQDKMEAELAQYAAGLAHEHDDDEEKDCNHDGNNAHNRSGGGGTYGSFLSDNDTLRSTRSYRSNISATPNHHYIGGGDAESHGGGTAYTDYTAITQDGDTSLAAVSIDDRVVSFDAQAARESLHFMGEALREIGDGFIVVGGGQACVSG